MRVSGHSMDGAGILDGDYVVVDRSLEARPGQVVVAVRAGEMTIKRLRRRKDGRLLLAAENPDGAGVTPDAAALRAQLVAANVTVLTSSAGTEPSREDPAWGNGAFTEALLEALGGAADTMTA